MGRRVLVIGATSKIAEAAARLWAIDGHDFVLVGRTLDRLEAMAPDLMARGASSVSCKPLDFADLPSHSAFVADLVASFGKIDIALFCHGLLGEQKEGELDFNKAHEVIQVNFLSFVSLLTPLANHMELNRGGSLVVVSSVAGDRGRQSNYIYGSAKGAMSLFAQGLRNRLTPANVDVITVKPGFVDTPMTAHVEKNKLFATPEVIGQGIVSAVEKRRNVVYLPVIWWAIMTVIKLIPEFIFKKLKL